MDRNGLEDRYRALVRQELPARARRDGWVLVADYCFGRVLLDDAVGGCWRPPRAGRARPGVPPAVLSDDRLAHAVATGERLLVEGDPRLRELDARSLAWRGKPPKPPHRATSPRHRG